MSKSGKTAFAFAFLLLSCTICHAQWGEGMFQVGEYYYHGNYSGDITIIDDIMYLSNSYGVEIWNTEDPSDPVLVNTVPLPQSTGGAIRIVDNLLY